MNRHEPVLPAETIDALALESGANVIDCTLGDAGHSEMILEQTGPDGKLLGIDADPESILRARKFLHAYGDRAVFVRDNFERLSEIIRESSFGPVNGILMDLGWSSPQFAERKRGFSFQISDEPLDMRYDPRLDCEHVAVDPPLSPDGRPLYGRCTAAEIVNTAPEDRLAMILRVYGEEKLHKQIAKKIVQKREVYPIESTGDMVDAILEAYREKLKTDKEVPWIGGIHPATKSFQALRIAVNSELDVLEAALPQAIEALAPGGRLAVISFHSLEDRIVKHFFKSQAKKTVNIITKKPITASEEEAAANPRARSAKLRVIEKR